MRGNHELALALTTYEPTLTGGPHEGERDMRDIRGDLEERANIYHRANQNGLRTV
jgi:hypothetical protein